MSDFKSIKIAYGLSVSIQQGDSNSVSVQSENEAFIAAISVHETKDRVEIIRERRGLINDLLFWKNRWKQDVTVVVQVADLRRIEAEYGCCVECEGLRASDLEVCLANGSSCDLHCNVSGRVSITMTSGAKARLSGACDTLSVQSDSSSRLDQSGLIIAHI